MTFYHGSPIGGLTELKPVLSEHGRAYVYFATNPLVALLYAVKPVPKPFSFYPYGFDRNGNVVYSEYYEDAFYDLYHGRSGYLYECDDLKGLEAPTQINCAYTSALPVKVNRVTKIPDLRAFYVEQEERGLFRVKHRNEISDREMDFVLGELKKDVEKFALYKSPGCEMSLFLWEHFPGVWGNCPHPLEHKREEQESDAGQQQA